MSDNLPSRIEQTAVLVLRHFEQEEQILADMLRSAQQVRAGLLSGNAHAKQEAFREHFEPPATLHHQRRDVRELIASALNIPADKATLRGLADHAPSPLRTTLMAAHQKMLGQIAEVDRLNRANAVLAACFIDLFQRLLADPSGQQPPTSRYSSTGEVRRRDSSKHSGLQIRC